MKKSYKQKSYTDKKVIQIKKSYKLKYYTNKKVHCDAMFLSYDLEYF